MRLQAQIPPAQHTLHNSPCSKVKLKEENKWTQTLQRAKLAGKMKRHQVTATGSDAMSTTPTTRLQLTRVLYTPAQTFAYPTRRSPKLCWSFANRKSKNGIDNAISGRCEGIKWNKFLHEKNYAPKFYGKAFFILRWPVSGPLAMLE